MTEINTSNINRLWADLLVEELVRSGAGIFCLAPGSRSTPLVTAVAANPRAEHVMHFDERGTAFYALGHARATRRPAVWITTSGTAVANGMPAVVEAAADGVPLVLLTADRPPELRETGANQTIDQLKFFGDHVRWQFDLPVPSRDVDPGVVLTTIGQAAYRARRMPSGPVHLNAPFREPLAPDDDGIDYRSYLGSLERWHEGNRPYTQYGPGPSRTDRSQVHRLGAALRTARRGLVVAGRLDTRAQADSVRWLAERLNWPLLPDAASQLRLGGGSPNAVPYYDLVLSSETFRKNHTPDAVLYVGGRATSKGLNGFLAQSRPVPYVVVRENPGRLDPHHRVTEHLETDIVAFCEELLTVLDEPTTDDAWVGDWRDASAKAGSVLVDHLAQGISEPGIARLISASIPDETGLVLASSMPVRDVDSYGAHDSGAPLVAANRGASGIDGTIATAAGYARGLGKAVTLLIGDLALLHDLNSLALLTSAPRPVIVIVINNRGGGIFSFLPIAKHDDVFEPYFGTPHDYSFEHAARQFGLAYERVEDCDAFTDSYRKALRNGVSHLFEVTTDRTENVRLHRQIEQMVSEELG